MLGVLPNIPGCAKSAGLTHGDHDFFDALYVYAWFTGFAIAGAVYFIGMKSRGRRATMEP